MTIDPAIRFWRFVTKGSGCWEWTGDRMRNGYGRFWVADRNVRAHRFSWQLVNGPIPKGLFVCHSCDNQICVRPDHLFLGTHADNMRDRVAKGRSAYGTANGNARLTEVDVRQIRASSDTQRALGRRYGVAQHTVFAIRHGLTWRHLLAQGDR